MGGPLLSLRVTTVLPMIFFSQFAIGHCRGLPPTPGKSGSGGNTDSGAEGAAAKEEENVDPAKEILATIGTGNAGKYLVASQVCRATRASTVARRGRAKRTSCMRYSHFMSLVPYYDHTGRRVIVDGGGDDDVIYDCPSPSNPENMMPPVKCSTLWAWRRPSWSVQAFV